MIEDKFTFFNFPTTTWCEKVICKCPLFPKFPITGNLVATAGFCNGPLIIKTLTSYIQRIWIR
ncbi:hypothetical protein SAMN04487891_103321 [Flagellimonas taeanensis]|uniref:Uncharacterized protein n=1 Tax=Flagellimonas taeanensis TaxID=1005926 RepID=A0A1I1EWV0_9FLAO|nr:hypothetical protein SAMN04487891_103321 [Allomuricauda taeanensis]